MSLVTPLNPSYGLLNLTFYSDFRYPELIMNFGNEDPDYAFIITKYGSLHILDKPRYIQELKDLFIEKIKKDWPIFIKNVMRNSLWLWDKEHLFAYIDPFYPADKIPLQIYNITLLLFYFIGIAAFIIKKGLTSFRVPVLWITILLFLYITTMISLVSNETRHSVACYSLIILWAGYGIASIAKL